MERSTVSITGFRGEDMADGLGVAVIGAGMAGRAHAAAFRTASALYNPVLPPIRLVSIGDVNARVRVAGRATFRIRTQRHLVAGDRRG